MPTDMEKRMRGVEMMRISHRHAQSAVSSETAILTADETVSSLLMSDKQA